MTETLINGRPVTRTLLAPDAAPAIAEYWVIEGGGHAWSGGDERGSFTDAACTVNLVANRPMTANLR